MEKIDSKVEQNLIILGGIFTPCTMTSFRYLISNETEIENRPYSKEVHWINSIDNNTTLLFCKEHTFTRNQILAKFRYILKACNSHSRLTDNAIIEHFLVWQATTIGSRHGIFQGIGSFKNHIYNELNKTNQVEGSVFLDLKTLKLVWMPSIIVKYHLSKMEKLTNDKI